MKNQNIFYLNPLLRGYFRTSLCIRASFLVAALLIISVVNSPAATITWSTPVTIAGDSDVQTAGTLDRAYALASSSAITLNNVSFGAWLEGGTSPDNRTTISAFSVTAAPQYGSPDFAAPYGNLDGTYQSLLDEGFYNDSGGTVTVTLNSLTIGAQYTIQVWASDSRGLGTRSETLDGQVTLNFSTGTDGSVGQYAVGTFTANATTQVISFTGTHWQLNALQLRGNFALPALSSLNFQQQPPVSAGVGATLSPEIQVAALGANGVPIPGVPVTLTLNGGSGTLNGTPMQQTDGNGLAHFADLSVSAPDSYMLTATSGSVTTNSASFTISQQTTISWNQPVTITGDTDVQTGGTVDRAYGLAESTNATVNGVTFTAWPGGDLSPDGKTFINGFATASPGTFASPDSPFSSLAPTAYPVLLGDGFYNDGGGTVTVSLNSLTAGAQYEVQVWANDSRGFANRTETIDNQIGLAFSTTTAGSLGQYAVGTFTASSTNQIISFTGPNWQLNMLQLQVLPAVQSLTFQQEPPAATNAGAILSPEIQVAAQDVNTDPIPGVPVTLTLNGSGTLSGTVTANADINGIAHFNNLSISPAGSYSLTATAGATIAGSSSITISAAVASLVQVTHNQNGSVTLNYPGAPNTQYHAQVSRSLSAPIQWSNLIGSTNTTGNSGAYSFTDTNTASFSPRFYRIVSP